MVFSFLAFVISLFVKEDLRKSKIDRKKNKVLIEENVDNENVSNYIKQRCVFSGTSFQSGMFMS